MIVALMVGVLRSPFLIPLFLFEVLLGRAQFDHPLSARIPIGDELPVRVLGIVFGSALWNGLLDALVLIRSQGWSESLAKSNLLARFLVSARIRTHSLVFSVLCMVGFYYSVAGIGKLRLGVDMLDWMRYSHMENLFMSSHLNGWLSFLSESAALDMAEGVRVLRLPIAILTLIFELGMAFVLVRQRGTWLILAAISAMHCGIVITSGVIFWKWLILDLALLVWPWLRREDPEIRRIYSRFNGAFSVVVIVGMALLFTSNQFAWWNTKWSMLYEIEVLDEDGEIYRVNHADFSPYTLLDLYKPKGRVTHTYAFGMTHLQSVMQFFEYADPEELREFGSGEPGRVFGRGTTRGSRVFSDFVTRHFRNRNAHPGRRVVPFLVPAPALHNRFLSGPDLYRDQKPVVEVRLRFKEFYYTGSELWPMRDEVVYSVPISPGKEKDG